MLHPLTDFLFGEVCNIHRLSPAIYCKKQYIKMSVETFNPEHVAKMLGWCNLNEYSTILISLQIQSAKMFRLKLKKIRYNFNYIGKPPSPTSFHIITNSNIQMASK